MMRDWPCSPDNPLSSLSCLIFFFPPSLPPSPPPYHPFIRPARLQEKGPPLVLLQGHGEGWSEGKAGSVSSLVFPRARRPVYSRTTCELRREGGREGGKGRISCES